MSKDDVGNIVVQCEYCDHRFETHDVGDLVACIECGEWFPRFTNIVDGDP